MDSTSVKTHVVVLLLESRSYAQWTHFADGSDWVVVPLQSTGQALRELTGRRPQLAVVGLSDPLDRSLRLLRLLRVRRPNLPVIVVPARHTRQTELTVRQIGAAGYVPEGCGSRELTALVTAMLDRATVRQGGSDFGVESDFAERVATGQQESNDMSFSMPRWQPPSGDRSIFRDSH